MKMTLDETTVEVKYESLPEITEENINEVKTCNPIRQGD